MIHLTVVSYRTPSDLGAFCRSVETFAPRTPWSLAIVNVSPRDEDMAVGEQWADRLGARHYWNPDNIGYGRGCNEGACCAKWPVDVHEGVLGFFNADVELRAGVIDNCYDGLMSTEDWGVLGPRQVDEHGRLVHAGIFGTQEEPKHRGWFRTGNLHRDVRADAVTVAGSAYLIRRSVWDHLRCCPIFRSIAPDARGAFLETPHYYEETWVSYHAAAHGWKAVYWGQDTLLHRWHRASRIGGYAEQQMPVSQGIFRLACDAHGIPHD